MPNTWVDEYLNSFDDSMVRDVFKTRNPSIVNKYDEEVERQRLTRSGCKKIYLISLDGDRYVLGVTLNTNAIRRKLTRKNLNFTTLAIIETTDADRKCEAITSRLKRKFPFEGDTFVIKPHWAKVLKFFFMYDNFNSLSYVKSRLRVLFR